MNQIIFAAKTRHLTVFQSRDIALVRQFVTGGEYFATTFLDSPKLDIGSFDSSSFDLFAKIVLLQVHEGEFNSAEAQQFLLDAFDVFVQDGRIFRDHVAMWQMFAHMLIYGRVGFLTAIASYINAPTWRNIYNYAMQHYSVRIGGEYDELVLVMCLKFAPYLFTPAEQRAIINWINGQFVMDDVDYAERFAAYVLHFNAANPSEIEKENILVADGKEFDVEEFLDMEWDRRTSIVDIDPRAYNKRFLKEMTKANNAFHEKTILIAGLRKLFKQARKRFCARELFEQMLAVIGLNLPVFLNYDLTRLTIDCVGTGVLSQFEAMQIIGRVAVAQRNADLRAEREAGERRTRSLIKK